MRQPLPSLLPRRSALVMCDDANLTKAVEQARQLHRGPYGMARYKLQQTLAVVEQAQVTLTTTQTALKRKSAEVAEVVAERDEARRVPGKCP